MKFLKVHKNPDSKTSVNFSTINLNRKVCKNSDSLIEWKFQNL